MTDQRPASPAGLSEVLEAAARAQDGGEAGVIVTVVESLTDEVAIPGDRLFVAEDGSVLGSIHPTLDPLLREDALASMANNWTGTRLYRLADSSWQRARRPEIGVEVFFEALARPAKLIVVGAGHIAVPLARMAKLLEFEVTVLDDRPEYANQQRFPDADQILVGSYVSTLSSLTITPETYIVLVTRGHVHDQACLTLVADSAAPYIGMIGSKRRVRTVLAHAREAGHPESDFDRVYAPVGLDIGAHTPAEIAVAIMAEIINVQRGGRSPSLALRRRVNA